MNTTSRFLRVPLFLVLVSILSTAFALPSTASQRAASLSVIQVTPGTTPFESTLLVSDPWVDHLASISFSIAPIPGATTTSLTATYGVGYLTSQQRVDMLNHQVTVVVYGLYENASNIVTLTEVHHSQTGKPRLITTTLQTEIATAAWNDASCSPYETMTINQARQASVQLNYEYFMLKDFSGCDVSPVVMDVDGHIRWVGTMPSRSPASTFFQNRFYLGQGSGTTLYRESLDGISTTVADYSGSPTNATSISHHNIEFGKQGILLLVNTTSATESTIVEVDGHGAVLNTFNLVTIFQNYIETHCDPAHPNVVTTSCSTPNPLLDSWIRPLDDWFHNNSATYWPARNELVVSSRENFVVGIDYDTKQIKWILGDTNKAWYQDALTLRPLALKMGNGMTLPPIGQHAVSITNSGDLLLFDDGWQSANQSPAGVNETYSAPREYAIDEKNMTATATWVYTHGLSISSQICSSVYEVGTSHLIDYADADGGSTARLIGLGPNDVVAFDYSIAGGPTWGWNALPVAISGIDYTRTF